MPKEQQINTDDAAAPKGPGVVKVGERGEAAASATGRWAPLDEAAAVLGVPLRTLRQSLTRHSRRTGDVIEARVDGVVARKTCGRWRVWLGPEWLNPTL